MEGDAIMMTKTEADALTFEEVEAMAMEIFRLKIEPTLTPDDKGRFVSIDVLSGEWEIDDDGGPGTWRLIERLGDRHSIFKLRYGHLGAYRSGPRRVEALP